MKNKVALPAGFRDWEPTAMEERIWLTRQIESVFRKYAFVPLDTPAVELMATLTGKGGTIDKQILRVQHGTKADWGLRFDFTVPLARYINEKKPSLPFRRYQIGSVWRGEKPQKGRLREFFQADADIVGEGGVLADAEIVNLAAAVMAALGLQATIKINHREILSVLAANLGIKGEKAAAFLIALDKREKVGEEKTWAEMKKLIDKEKLALVEEYLQVRDVGSLREIFGSQTEGAIARLEEVFSLTDSSLSSIKIIFDPSLARGLDYYTGIILEAVLEKTPAIGSVAGGGRYDHLIGRLGGREVPAVGVSFGISRLWLAFREEKRQFLGVKKPLLLVNFSQTSHKELMGLASFLRQAGLGVVPFLSSPRIGDQLGYAQRQGIRWVVIWGPEEKKKGLIKLKDMEKKEEKTFSSKEELGDFLKKALLDSQF